jgi:hypothetical protein
MQTLINAHIFHPAFKDVKERCELTFCDNAENCPLLKKGKCVQNIGIFGGVNCPHGKNQIEYGFTKRAQHFRGWMHDKEKQYADVLEKVDCKYAYEKLVDLGDYVYLPYPHITNYVNSLPFVVNSHFVKKEDFTPAIMMSIIGFRPEALFGGTITSFQEKEAPRFVEHLMTEMPEKYAELIEQYPDIKTRFSKEKMNYVKRKAILSTVKIGAEFKDYLGNICVWDGEYFTCENWNSSFLPFHCKTASIKAKPKENDTIEITDNNQVDDKTRFVD